MRIEAQIADFNDFSKNLLKLFEKSAAWNIK